MSTNYSIRDVLRKRDGMEAGEIDEVLEEVKRRILEDGEDPQDVLEEEVGLEPDYIMDPELGLF